MKKSTASTKKPATAKTSTGMKTLQSLRQKFMALDKKTIALVSIAGAGVALALGVRKYGIPEVAKEFGNRAISMIDKY